MENIRPVISVIVPVYNVEKYLDKCVSSVMAQTFKDIEILLIDDGSKDASGRMCDDYALTDSRIRVIHKENGGLSDARNRGITEARGRYLSFIDGDDYIEPDMLETLYNNLVREDADASMCGIYSEYADRQTRFWPNDEYLVLTGNQPVKAVLEGRQGSINAVNKLYKRELFSEIRFPLGKLCEDAFIMVKLMAQVNKAVVDTRPKYHYVHRGDSITTSAYKKKDMHLIEAYIQNREFIYANMLELKVQIDFRYFWAHYTVLDKMLNTSGFKRDEDFKYIVRTLRRNYFAILRNPITGRGRKIALTGLMLGSWLYKLIIARHYKSKRRLVG